MRRPPPRVMLLGHPVVMVPVMGVGLFCLFHWTQDAEFTFPAIMALVAMGFVGRANQHRMEFMRWKQAWDSMADGDPGSRRGPLLAKLAIAAIVPAGFALIENGAFDHADKALGWGVLAILVAGCWAMVVRARRYLTGGVRSDGRARSASRSDAVSICARSSMRVPSIEDAYRALPAYCWRVLNPGSD